MSSPSRASCTGIDGTSVQFDGTLCLSGSGASEIVFGERNGFLTSSAVTCPSQAVTVNGTPSLVATSDGGSSDVFLGSSGRGVLSKYNFSTATWTSMGSTSTFNLFPQGLFAFGTVVGGGGPTTGGAFVMSSAGTLSGSPSQYAPMNTNPGGAAVVASGSTAVFGDTGGGLVKVAMTGATIAQTATDIFDAGGTDLSTRSALVGEGGHTYVIGTDRTLRVLSGLPATEEWNWPASAGGIQGTGTISQMALDVGRDAGAKACSKPGVLYVAGTQGDAGHLYAFIVDSRGLDATAPWPKFQHDNANTGNPATPLTNWSCS